MEKEWDVFISHAFEDESFVRPLAEALAQLGVKVWYSDFSLSPGESLSRSIDKGLASSRFGVVVISQFFMNKKWPERELRGLVANEIAGKTVIIPLWLGVSENEVSEFSPPLADTFAVKVSGMTAEHVAIGLLKTIRPDIYESHPRADLEKMVKGEALEELQIELKKAKDELRELIATEYRNIVKFTCGRVINPAIELTDIHHAMTAEGQEERKVRQKIAREISSIVLEAAEDYLREAQARVIEKSDPKRAEFVRNFKPTF